MDMLDQKNVMNKLSNEDLKNLEGGTSLTGSLISAFTSAFKTVFEFGRSLGNSIRRINEGKMCEIS